MKQDSPGDLVSAATKKYYNDPKAIAQLERLKNTHDRIERLETQIEAFKKLYKADAEIMVNMLDVLGLNHYELPGGFRCFTRLYRDVQVEDKAKLLATLKKYCTPAELVHFITPPCSMADLKRMLIRLEEENEDLDFELEGISSKNTYSLLKTEYINERKKDVKKRDERGYKHKRSSDHNCPKKFGKTRRERGNVSITRVNK